MSISQIIAVPILLILPGLVCARLLCKQRSAVLLFCIPFSVPFTAMCAFLLARFDHLTLLNLCIADLAVVAFLAMLPAGKAKPWFPSLELRFVIAVLLLCVGFFAYFAPPFEY